MKLSELPRQLWRQISNAEHDLECEVKFFKVELSIRKGNDIILHEWEYKSKEVKPNG